MRSASSSPPSDDLERLFEDIDGALDILFRVTDSTSVTVATSTTHAAQSEHILQQSTSALSDAFSAITIAKQSAAELTHDTELFARSSWALRALGLDLAQILPNNGSAGAQTGAAHFLTSSAQPCHPVALGEFGLEVPLTLLGADFVGWVNLAVSHVHGSGRTFEAIPSSEVLTCPEDALTGVAHEVFRKQFFRDTNLEREVSLPTLSLGPMPEPTYLLALTEPGTGTVTDSGISFLGQVERRSRYRRGLLPVKDIPAWADLAYRMDLRILLNLLDQQAGHAGGRIVGAPAFLDDHTLQLTARVETEKSAHVGCVTVGIRVWADVPLLATIDSDGTRTISLTSRQNGPYKIGSDVYPNIPGVDWLLEQLIDYVGNMVANALLPAVTFSSPPLTLADCARISCSLTPDGLSIFAQHKWERGPIR